MLSRSLIACLLLIVPASEPAARPARAVPLKFDPAIANISGVRELPDGRLLISDAKKPAVYVLDGRTGRAEVVGSAGAGEGQYVQPGGFYCGAGDTTLLLDRGQKRVLSISRDGRISGAFSIAVKGQQSSSSRDVDLQQPDASGHAYFLERGIALPGTSNSQPLLRFDPVKQTSERVAQIGLPEEKVIAVGDRMTYGRQIMGSPADGWGVLADGRVAVVRAVPYHVEWYHPGGTVVRGAAVDYDPLPMTDADRKAYADKIGPGPSVGVAASGSGGRGGSPNLGMLFAPTKAPFDPESVKVSPEGRVWVERSRPAGAATVIYDVFDATGRRAARVEFPAGSRVMGFGPASVYVRETGAGGAVTLKKYAA